MLTNWIWRLLARFRSEEGQALAEYGLILALIAVVCILALTAIGLGISGTLGGVGAAGGAGWRRAGVTRQQFREVVSVGRGHASHPQAFKWMSAQARRWAIAC